MGQSTLKIFVHGEEREVPLGEQFVVGSQPNADLLLERDGIEDVHLVINGFEGGYYVDAVGRGEGTTLNGARLAGRRALAHGDEIVVADARLEVSLTAPTTRRHRVTERLVVDPGEDHGARSLEAVRSLLHLINSVGSETDLLEEVLGLTAPGVSADWAVAVVRTRGDRVQLRSAVRGGEPPPDWESVVRVVLEGESLRRLVVHPTGEAGLYVAVPGREDSEPLALCYARAPGAEAFSEEEARWIQSIGSQLSDALRRLRLVEEVERLQTDLLDVRDQERRRIGQDLHDGICQELVGIGMIAKLLEKQLKRDGSEHTDEVHRIAVLVDKATSRARALARGLSPIALDDEYALMLALGELAGHAQEVFGIECAFLCEEPVRVRDSTVASHLYYLAQEAVGNAGKHSGGKQVRIELSEVAGSLVLLVNDDGKGLGDHEPGLGMGLRVMRQRARQIRAQLAFERGALGGLCVRCTLPWHRPSERDVHWLYAAMLEAPALLQEGVRYVVGRTKEADLRLPSSRVSRRHAELRWEKVGFVIADLGSTNGTSVNGQPLTEPMGLKSGDRISFGGCEAVLRVMGAEEDLGELGDITQRISPAREPRGNLNADAQPSDT